MTKTICIFAGARGKSYLYDDARLITSDLVRSGWDIIYGGSSKGVMGAVCDQVKKEGGTITGVLPEKVANLRHYDPDINMVVRPDMSSRKQYFWTNSSAYLLLPGGFGSLDEFFEVLTLIKLGYLPRKPVLVYNGQVPSTVNPPGENWTEGCYDSLTWLIDDMVSHGLMEQSTAELVTFVSEPFEVCQFLRQYEQALERQQEGSRQAHVLA